MILRIYRQASVRGPLYYCINPSSESGFSLSSRAAHFIPSWAKDTALKSLENCLIGISGQKSNIISILHPADLSPDDILITFSDAAYEYRSSSIGNGSIIAACAYTLWAMPAGGWFVLLFKQAALPIFSIYGAVQFIRSHAIAEGAETMEKLIRSGQCEFFKIDDS